MKTKTIELKLWAGWLKKNDPSADGISIFHREVDMGEGGICVPCTITFEIPIPEPKKEITPKIVDEIFENKCITIIEYSERAPFKGTLAEYIKSKLFPGWES